MRLELLSTICSKVVPTVFFGGNHRASFQRRQRHSVTHNLTRFKSCRRRWSRICRLSIPCCPQASKNGKITLGLRRLNKGFAAFPRQQSITKGSKCVITVEAACDPRIWSPAPMLKPSLRNVSATKPLSLSTTNLPLSKIAALRITNEK